MQDVTIARVDAPDDEVRLLIGELEAVLSAEYAPEQRHGLAIEAIFNSGVRFFVARVGGQPAGCCGVALFDGFAELKRMYVRPAQRGTGVAQVLLARVEAEVRQAGLSRLLLETGDKQHAAIRMYERAGFTRCQVFGAYAAMPPNEIETSVFMEKQI